MKVPLNISYSPNDSRVFLHHLHITLISLLQTSIEYGSVSQFFKDLDCMIDFKTLYFCSIERVFQALYFHKYKINICIGKIKKKLEYDIRTREPPEIGKGVFYLFQVVFMGPHLRTVKLIILNLIVNVGIFGDFVFPILD